MRWWLVLCASVLWTSVTSQGTNGFKNAFDQSRAQQCCPCPEEDLEPAGNSPRSLATSNKASGRGLQPLADIAGVDCPCRFRDADSEGSASGVSSKAVQPYGSLENAKEDTKPLLHPEVGLASSVLETLREATEEDYNEALARDAARSISRSMEPDGIAEESRNLVTYVVSPKQELDNDVVPKASHIQEASYIDSPLGRTNTRRIPSLIITPDLQTGILNLQSNNPSSLKNIFDMDSSVGASNVNENVFEVTPENGLEGSNGNSNIDLSNILLKDRFKDLNIPKVNDFLKNVHDKVSGLRTTAKAADKSTDETNVLHKILNLIPNINSVKSLSQNEVETKDDMQNSDNVNSPSSVVERYSGFASDSLFKTPQAKTENTSSGNKNTEEISPFEYFKNKIFRINIPQLNKTSTGRDDSSDLLSEVIKSLEKTGNLLPLNLFNGQRQIPSVKSPDMKKKEVQNTYPTLKDDKTFSTEIIDTIPSTSSVQANAADVSTLDCLKKPESTSISNDNSNVEAEILDNLSNSQVIIDSSKADNEITEANVEEITEKYSAHSNENADDDITGTEIITHIPRDIDATVNDLESIPNVDEATNSDIDESFKLDEENCSDNKEDMLSDTSNNVANVASIKESDDVFQRPSLDKTSSESLNEDLERSNTKPDLNGIDDSTETADGDIIEADTNNKLTFREKLLQRLKSSPKTTKTQKTSTTADVKQETTDKSNQLSIDDLQNMSNSLLDQEKILIDALADQTKKIIIPKTDMNDESQIVSTESLETSKDNLDANADASEANPVGSSSKLECPSGMLSSTQTNFNDNAKEMASEASERVTNAVALDSIIKSSIFPNVVQPLPSLFNRYDNLFNRPIISLPNVLNNPLRMLSTSRNSKTNGKVAKGNNKLSSDNSVLKKDGEVLPLASTSNYKSAFPPLQPLEDINLDFLQLKPLSLSQSSPFSGIPALPRLNLNSYKTKLSLPKSLDLKPVLLESTLRNNKGMVGATVTFGKKKEGIGHKNSALQKVSDLHASPVVLPRLDDLRENFLEKAQNLLSTPLETSSRNMIEDTLRSSQVLTENFKVQAKNTVNDLKKNFEQSLKEAALQRSSILGNSFTSSDFLQAVSLRHEDFGDKLKGIHQDFTDRLETLRNDFFDQIPSLSSPIARQSKMTLQPPSRLSSKNKNYQLSQKTPGKFKFSTPRKDKNKTLKMQPASSVLTPRFAESSQSAATLPDLSHLHSMRKPAPLSSKLGSMNRPLLDILQNHKKTMLSKSSFKPKFRESKVTITFSTTPRPANLKFKPLTATTDSQTKLKSKSLLDKDSSILQSNIKSKTLPGSKLKSVSEPAVSPSELKLSKLEAPLRIPIRSKLTTIKDISTAVPPTSSFKSKLPLSSNLKPPILKNPLQIDETLRSVEDDAVKSKTPSVSANTISNFNKESLKTSLAATRPPSWPRTVDDTFLTKVREAVKARLAEIASKTAKPATTTKLGKTEPEVDMARSASNKVEMVSKMIEPMVENTSYSCKMMCTKNS